MERLDKVISNQTGYSRKEVKEILKQKRVKVNYEIITKPETKVDPTKDVIEMDHKELGFKEFVYLVLNKPKGYVSATVDNINPTVLDLVPDEYIHRHLFPAGRLDKDTTGLMIITDDGEFAHDILSPKKHISKTYLVEIDKTLTEEMREGFFDGIRMTEGVVKAKEFEFLDQQKATVTLTEGRYHQVKRMFHAYHAEVLELKRIKMGHFSLPEDLEEGEIRELTEEELQKVKMIL